MVLVPQTDLYSFFSEERFSCLDYLDDSELDPASRAHISEQVCDLLGLFFQVTKCTYLPFEKDTHLRQQLWGWAEKELTHATSYDMGSLQPVLEAAASFTESCYPLASNEMRLSMSQGTAFIVSLDSYLIHPTVKQNLAQSQCRLSAGLKPLDDFSSSYSAFTKEVADLYGSLDPLIGTLSASGWGQHVEGWCLEEQIQLAYSHTQCEAESESQSQSQSQSESTSKSRPAPQSQSQSMKICHVEDFPFYLRSITGVPIPYITGIFKPTRGLEVPYTLWMSCLPALKVFACLSNDLFSYPKELLDCEKFNFINIQTKTKQDAGFKSQFVEDRPWTVRDTLYETANRAVQCVRAIDEAFGARRPAGSSSGARSVDYEFQLAATLWSLFKQGYISWHIRCPRYRLDTLRSRFEGSLQVN
ncbi:hypothetical protein BO70DRAFT_184596 [Aspergillus heteromorphus CBS 117.55]|uniref:Terpenoid synthase n=1 Tax=Aspergillus heteromorphus CBS 117.55 TaxID=1448321 RepID=A0A317WW71_9EURO|nr:uncharacterized protein BO70DRAFT_184596 [Aspergillus heteromorphus CBS 117.55]PWY88550.1 hypothetical protein BO70DRAFT_184596 [Aspergillus heteromorphus CBS 117.55]